MLMSRIKYDLKNDPEGKYTMAGNFVRKVGWSRGPLATQHGLSSLGEPRK
jgi:hypothetical protein